MGFGKIMNIRKNLALAAFAGVAFAALLPQVSEAGFEWVPGTPEAPAADAPANDMPAVPHTQGTIEQTPLLTPEIGGEAAAVVAPAPQTVETQTLAAPVSSEPVLKVKTITPPPSAQPDPALPMPAAEPDSAPPAMHTRVVMPQDAPSTAVDNTPNAQAVAPYTPPTGQPEAVPPLAVQTNFTAVEGFGKDVPLALALQQVVPAEYAYAFDKSVNPGHRVSWTGGKPWNDVVTEMVAPLRMEAHIIGKTVRIRSLDAGYVQGEQQGSFQQQKTPSEEPISLSAKGEIKRSNITDPGQGEEYAAHMSADSAMLTPQTMDAPTTQNTSQTAADYERIESASGTQDDQIIPLLPQEASAPAPQGDVRIWQAEGGKSLKEILTVWSNEANVDLVWNAAHDYNLNGAIMVSDTFQNAVDKIIANGLNAPAQPAWTFISNAGQNQNGRLIIEDPRKNAG